MTVIHELAPGVSLVERSTILLIGSVAAASALSLPVNTLWMGRQAGKWLYPQTGKGAVVMINCASGSLLRFEILLSIASAYGRPRE